MFNYLISRDYIQELADGFDICNKNHYYLNNEIHLFLDKKTPLLSNKKGLSCFFSGSGLYKDTLISCYNLLDIVNDIIISPENYKYLSGHFSIVYIISGNIYICNSLFGTYPTYITKNLKYISDNEVLLSKINKSALNKSTLKIIAKYYARYGHNIFNQVSRLGYSTITKITPDNISNIDCLQYAIPTVKFCSLNNTLEKINNRLIYLLKRYSDSDLRVGLTGGRDSRLFLSLAKESNIHNISAYTVGKNKDIEAYIAKKVSHFYAVTHDIFSPSNINNCRIEWYSNYINNANFPILYKTELISYLKKTPRKHLNSAIPETLLCHIDYFNGDDHPCQNFIKNRGSKLKTSINIDKNDDDMLYHSAIKIWNSISKRTNNNELLTKLFFEQVTYQREWVYNILKIGDFSGGTICVFEDPIVLSLLSSIPEHYFYNDYLYSYYINNFHPDMNSIISTRDTDVGRVAKLPKLKLEFWKLLPLAIKNDPLEYLVSKNHAFMINLIKTERNRLTHIFSDDFISNIINNSKYYPSNRILRFLLRRLNKKVYSNYEIIMPFCIALILSSHSVKNHG